MNFAVPFEKVLTLSSEEIDVRFEVQFEDVIFMDVFRLSSICDGVTQQRQTGQRKLVLTERNERESRYFTHSLRHRKRSVCLSTLYLVCFVEEQGEIGENHPEFLPAVAVFELSEQIS